ncbi:MAG: (2Fe-2S)-binding protein [Steroidobacteraceae bacterium]
MYVCVCRAISERQIRESVHRGASSLEEVKRLLPVASCCGCCEETARELVQSEVRSKAQPAVA